MSHANHPLLPPSFRGTLARKLVTPGTLSSINSAIDVVMGAKSAKRMTSASAVITLKRY